MRSHQIFPMEGLGPNSATGSCEWAQDSDPELLSLCLQNLQGAQALPALSPPAGMVAAPECPHLIQLSWWERPVFSRVKADIVLVPLWEWWQDGQS